MSDITLATGRVVEILKKDATAAITAFRLEYKKKQIRCIYGKCVPIDRQIVQVVGTIISDIIYGEQFKVCSLRVISKDKPAIKTYLMDPMFAGIGPILAEKIVQKFGGKTLSVIRDNPEKLAEIKGITLTKAKFIHDIDNRISISPKDRLLRDLISTESEQLEKIYGTEYGQNMRHPYDVIYYNSDVSIDYVDKIALLTGMHLDDDERIGAYLYKLLFESQSCYLDFESLQKAVLNKYKSYEIEISADKVIQVINNEISRNHLINDNGKIYHPKLYDREISLCQMICDMISSEHVFPQSSIERGIQKAESESSKTDLLFTLDDEQKIAIETSLKSRLSVITGGPGTGKSTIIKALINAWEDCKAKKSKIYLYAPTGKAARRMSSVTGYPAETIHRSLWRRKNPAYVASISPHSLVIIDECSMIDLDLAYEIIKIAYDERHTMVLIGDKDQLPPIGQGSFFVDLIRSTHIPKSFLTKSHRQDGVLDENAKKINEGYSMSELDLSTPQMRFTDVAMENIISKTIKEYQTLLKSGYTYSDIAVIIPTRDETKGKITADTLNKELREVFNPLDYNEDKSQQKDDVHYIDFHIGDRVMQLKNNYTLDIYNGDCGTITFADYTNGRVDLVTDDGRKVTINGKDLDDLTFAYAMTIHKSQGSEYKAVIVILTEDHANMLHRNLLYTAITRAKEKVIMLGNLEAFNTAIQSPAEERKSALANRIDSYFQNKIN